MRVSPDTAVTYQTATRAYLKFMRQYQNDCPPFPATNHSLQQFVYFQSQSCSADTLRGYLSHVRDYQENVLGYAFASITTRFTVQAALKGVKRAFGTSKKKKMAITVDMLKRIHATIQDGSFQRHTRHSPQAIRCIWAAIMVGFFGMLRKAYVSSKRANSFDPNRCLTRDDLVWIEGTDALWIRSRFSKTNQARARTHYVPLQNTGGPLCPRSAVHAHISDFPDMAAQGEPQPAFMYEVKGKRKALAHTFFVKTMKQMLEYIGERPMHFSSHSLRRGGATLANLAGGIHHSGHGTR